MKQKIVVVLLSILSLCSGIVFAKGPKKGSFYKRENLFSTRPSETKSMTPVDRFGPVGMGIELHQPAFVMKIRNIEEDSPADATGKLKKGQIIETINSQKLADIDPRLQLAQIMGAAEATDGVLKFMIKDKPDSAAQEVIVKVPVLGAYSKTWPLNCPKSNNIVRDFADHLAKRSWPGSVALNGPQMLFLLSTGEEKDLNVVRGWIKKTVAHYAKADPSPYAWFIGYGAVPLAEYYLRTGDKSILPVIKKFADKARDTMYLGCWAGRGGVPFPYMGGGHMNAAGTNVLTFLLLAKECGVDVDEYTLQTVLKQFYRYAGRGNNPYGDGYPEVGFIDNGKTGALAFAMAAAASLTPDGENSVYAKARDVSAIKGFYATSFMLHGHTGGGIAEIWRSSAMGLMYDKSPRKYREFMDNRMWHLEMSRRFDGSFGILGGARYDDPKDWGVMMGLSYTVPRKTLRITGAPKTKYVHEYQLPKRPWGTKADDKFFSLDAAVDKFGKSAAIDEETLANASALPALRKMGVTVNSWAHTIPKSKTAVLTTETYRYYAHHQDHGLRNYAAKRALATGNDELIVEMLKSKDPRVRKAGAYAIHDGRRGTIPAHRLTKEMVELMFGMINDPDESWWVVANALKGVSLAPAEMVGPHVDKLLEWLQHDEWWLRNSALMAITPISTDERYYKKIYPVLGRMIAANKRANVLGPLNDIVKKLGNASPNVQKAAVKMLGKAYENMPKTLRAHGGADLTSAIDYHLNNFASNLASMPGGFDELYTVSKKCFPDQSLPHSNLYLANNDPSKFGPKVKKALLPIIEAQLIPEYVGKNRRSLTIEAGPNAKGSRAVEGLVGLYSKVGIDDYQWHPFGLDMKNLKWEYHSFDPKEKLAWDASPVRFREVTYPAGMENWFAVDFDAKKAGWEKALPPFGQYMGKLVTTSNPCRIKICVHGEPMRTLWEKEVLLLRGTFKVPPLKDGHLYRLRIGTGAHVGSGAGYIVYINGKQLGMAKSGIGRGSGGKARHSFIGKEWAEEFKKGEVVIAATSFLKFGSRYKYAPSKRVPQGRITLWLEEMKFPPLGAKEIKASAVGFPMHSAKYQESFEEADKFRYDGKFVANRQVLGKWTACADVKAIDEFDPDKRNNSRNRTFRDVTFKNNGDTNNKMLIWSGDTIMDLNRNHALKMTVKKIKGTDYLFMEVPSFNARKKGWNPSYYVLKRVAK